MNNNVEFRDSSLENLSDYNALSIFNRKILGFMFYERGWKSSSFLADNNFLRTLNCIH